VRRGQLRGLARGLRGGGEVAEAPQRLDLDEPLHQRHEAVEYGEARVRVDRGQVHERRVRLG
jgi:hypothetical protein